MEQQTRFWNSAAVDEAVPEPDRDTDRPFLMPVEDVFSISQYGCDRQIETGVCNTGEEIEIVGIETPDHHNHLFEMFRKILDEAKLATWDFLRHR